VGGAATLTAFNCLAIYWLIFTIYLTSPNIHCTPDTSSDNSCFEFLKGNISLFDLCGCGIWSITLKEKHRLKGGWE
jgi:hypothetical protein